MACWITAEAVGAIRRHSVSEYPRESCGLLLGRDLHPIRRVDHAVAAANVDAAATRHFTIAPQDFLAAERDARARGLDVVGFYHSHPDAEALPSRSDVAEGWEHYTYLIVSVREGRALDPRGFRLKGGAFVEEPIVVTEVGAGEGA
jgi:proteasome lid subunit RPN8/RPN11